MAKNVVLLFDGTWNKPSDENRPEHNTDTNVRRFFKSIKPQAENGREQVAWYNAGVGTEFLNRIRGGAFGQGIDAHICDGYRELCRQYEPGDNVFILGFSRGAYTARSLVGMVRKCGLLKSDSTENIGRAYALYRDSTIKPGDPGSQDFRTRESAEITIHFLGVWDTVGALGIPVELLEQRNLMRYQFHDTRLSGIVSNAFHAIAIDEHRHTFQPTLWEVDASRPDQRVEQVWFPGAHADVGGGYVNQPLSNPPLRWMQKRACECGLDLRQIEEGGSEEYLSPATDSYVQFLGGAYAQLHDRYLRPVSPGKNAERIHWTVVKRLDDTRYSPRNPGLATAIIRDQFIDAEA
jgi:uncharacterized protein (DUF2235 family)